MVLIRLGIAAVVLISLSHLSGGARAQGVEGRPLPNTAYRGGEVARIPPRTSGSNGSAGTGQTYTGVGIPTGGSAINRAGQFNPPAGGRWSR